MPKTQLAPSSPARGAGTPTPLTPILEAPVDAANGLTHGAKVQSSGWMSTLGWVGAILVWYFTLQTVILPWAIPSNADARALMLSQVPIRIYEYSEAAFFTAAVLNLISFIFEDTQEKRQLALLSALIKGLSWHCDYLIVTGRAVITFDGYGALMLPSRYVQWSCTTPTILFTLAKISDFSPQRIALTMFCDWVMIVTGYISAEFPPGVVSYFACFVSFATFYVVLWNLYLMMKSALAEANSFHAKMSLHFTLWSSMVIWHIFPLGWCLARMGPSFAVLGEPMCLFANFAAKVVFSSCIMYNNFVTLQQRRVAAQLEQEHRDRIRMVAELKSAVQHKDEFLLVIGHELRTPLNAVIQLSTAITAKFGDPASMGMHRVWMETITRSAKHLLGIINDIITMRAARSGMHLKQELVYINHVVDHVIRTLAPMAKRGVVIEKVVADKLSPIVADERRVIQLLSNLLGNALKFTDKGGVAVRVRMDRGGRNVIIKIQDTGCGIPRNELRNLLVPFKQADMSSKRKYGGTGLGLSIAHQLVEAHTGKLVLESEEGKGTVAVVTLPVLQLETLLSLEAPFRKEYEAKGFDFFSLMDPTAAEAEGRRVAVFRKSLDSAPSVDKRVSTSSSSLRSSIDSQNAVVERFNWGDQFAAGGADDDDDNTESAAASGQAGPPPMAIALVSSLYASSAPAGKPAAAAAAASAPGTAPPSSSRNAVPEVLMMSDPNSVALLASGNYSQTKAAPNGAATAPKQPLSEATATAADAVTSTSRSPTASEPMARLTEMEELEEELEWDEYAGSWHRPAKFGDAHDKDKAYYAYDNRISYEYRRSLDAGGTWLSNAPSEVSKGIIRRSIDNLRSSFELGSGSYSSSHSSNHNAELKEKFFGFGLKSSDRRSSWQATRKNQ